MTADLLLSECRQHRTDADLPSRTSPPKYRMIGSIGMSLASTFPLNLDFLRTLDQSCAGIHTPLCRTYRASVQHVLGVPHYSLLLP
jgi:hypothetical protein